VVRCDAPARLIGALCTNAACVPEAFQLLMTLSDLLPLCWQMDYWSCAAGVGGLCGAAG
jgi:hypothetical protein